MNPTQVLHLKPGNFFCLLLHSSTHPKEEDMLRANSFRHQPQLEGWQSLLITLSASLICLPGKLPLVKQPWCCCLHAADVNHDETTAMWQQQNVRAPLRRQDDREQNRPAQLIIPDTEQRLLISAGFFSVLHKIPSAIHKYNQRGEPTSFHRAVGHTTKAAKGETKREGLWRWHFVLPGDFMSPPCPLAGKRCIAIKIGSRREDKDIFYFSSPSLHLGKSNFI